MEAYTFVRHQNYKTLTDTEIVNRIMTGEKQLFEVIMRRYNQRLFRVQRSYINDEHEVQEILQLTYIKVFEKLDTFKGVSAFSTWITRIAINEALQHLKRRKIHTKLHIYNDDDTVTEEKYDGLNPEEHYVESEMKQIIEIAIDSLPIEYREVYVMREIEEMSTRDVAEILNLSESNVKIRLMRAKEILRNTLESKVRDAGVYEFLGERCDAIVRNVMMKID